MIAPRKQKTTTASVMPGVAIQDTRSQAEQLLYRMENTAPVNNPLVKILAIAEAPVNEPQPFPFRE